VRTLQAGGTFSVFFILGCNSSNTFVSPLLTCPDSAQCAAYQQCLALHPREFFFCDDAAAAVPDAGDQ
jgi:hypothetical protein